jgi:hypothetical protein
MTSSYGRGVGRRDPGALGPGLCRIVDADFREFTFF